MKMNLSEKATASIERAITLAQTEGTVAGMVRPNLIKRATPVPFDRWSWSNRMLAFLQSGSTDCRGFRQWEAAGRKVKKGASAIYILRPVTIRKRPKDGAEDEDAGRMLIGFQGQAVFPIDATEGPPPPEYEGGFEPATPPPLYDLAARLGIEVQYLPLPPDRAGDCDIDGTKVRLGTTDPEVFFHELAHALRVRVTGQPLTHGDKAEEVAAELTAHALLEVYGYPPKPGNLWAYAQHFSPDPLAALRGAVDAVAAVLEFIFPTERGEQENDNDD